MISNFSHVYMSCRVKAYGPWVLGQECNCLQFTIDLQTSTPPCYRRVIAYLLELRASI